MSRSETRSELPQVGHLERLRGAELQAVADWLKPGSRVLEIGGGRGYQAYLMRRLGCDVVSVDVVQHGQDMQFHPVEVYDGVHIPAGDGTVDIVFSSNVLEHVQPLAPLLVDVRRVLKPEGIAIHMVPTPSWRLWTSLAAYPWLLEAFLGKSPVAGVSDAGRDDLVRSVRGGSVFRKVGKAARMPLRAHGVYGSAPAELYYFRGSRWRTIFEENGFHVVHRYDAGLFYTGYALAPAMSLEARKRLARVLGASCQVFVLRARALPRG